jgi:hypothetical protein
MSTQPDNADSGRGAGPDGRDGRDAGRDGRDASRGAGHDITAEFQRWLIRSSARNMRQELTGQFRKTFGRAERDNVWGVATTERPPDSSGEAPECAWCPVCRAARRIRESGPGVGGQLAGAGDMVAAAVQEAMSAFEAVWSMGQRADRASGFPAGEYPADRFPADRFPVAGTGPEHEPDDRD